MNGSADPASLDRRFPGSVMACDQQDDVLPRVRYPLQRKVDRLPRAIEAESVQVDDSVRLDCA